MVLLIGKVSNERSRIFNQSIVDILLYMKEFRAKEIFIKKDEISGKAKKENLFNDKAQNYKYRKESQWGLAAATIAILIIMIINYIYIYMIKILAIYSLYMVYT